MPPKPRNKRRKRVSDAQETRLSRPSEPGSSHGPAAAGYARMAVSNADTEDRVVVRSNDVLLGRGKGSYQSEGNRNLKELMSSRIEEYSRAVRNRDKIRITSGIVTSIQQQNGRFLLDETNQGGTLSVVSDEKARIKVAQAMRHRLRQMGEGKRSGRKEASQQEGEDHKRRTKSPDRAQMKRQSKRSKIQQKQTDTSSQLSESHSFNDEEQRIAGQTLFSSSTNPLEGSAQEIGASSSSGFGDQDVADGNCVHHDGEDDKDEDDDDDDDDEEDILDFSLFGDLTEQEGNDDDDDDNHGAPSADLAATVSASIKSVV